MHMLIVSLLVFLAGTFFSQPLLSQTPVCLDRADRMIRDAHWYMDEVYDMEDLPLKFDREVVCRQHEWDNLVGFNTAFERALDAIFYDANDPESPLALFIDWVFFNYGWDYGDYFEDEVEELARRELLSFVNRESSSLRLVKSEERPAGGESARHNWIFELRIPEFSDHVFWTVEDRRGEEYPYIYGFN